MYGAQGQQQAGIGAKRNLSFEVELKSIEPPKQQPDNAAIKNVGRSDEKQQAQGKII